MEIQGFFAVRLHSAKEPCISRVKEPYIYRKQAAYCEGEAAALKKAASNPKP